MELCPRCTSGLAPGLRICLMCGAEVRKPEAELQTVAVTAAPVALVPPAPPSAAEPPPIAPAVAATLDGYAVPQCVPPVGSNPSVRSVVVTLPPQRTTSPEPPPAAMSEPASAAPPSTASPTFPTVLPVTPPARRAASQLAIACATFLSLVAVVVLVFALPAHGAKTVQPGPNFGNSAAQLDLRNLASAEETTLTATTRYSTDTAELESVGYVPSPGHGSTVRAGVHGKKSYCLVASVGGSAPWWLFDSVQGGLISKSFASEAAAEHACADPAITSFVTVS